MEVLFKAFDGKIFTDEDECREYEVNTKYEKIKKEIISLDAQGRILTNLIADYDLAFTIAVGSTEAAEFLENAFEEAGIYSPDLGFKPNCVYWWDEEKERWVDVADRLDQLEEEINFFEEKLNLLENFY